MKSRHIYFVGIGGTLMGSLAQLAKSMGYKVSGCDNAVYPPMSDLLAQADITVHDGFHTEQLQPAPDMIVIGNTGLPRGHEAVEYILDNNLPYTSGAQWLGDVVLRDRWVIAVAGTHGKTTTASMVAWILKQADMQPGYLIGGAPRDLSGSAELGDSPFFVVEADEYDTNYFDRRSKFVHYRPRTLILNNLEYDHADIFPDISAIQTQFHNLLRCVPGTGLIIAPSFDENINEVLAMGCWTEVARVGDEPVRKALQQDTGGLWQIANPSQNGSEFDVLFNGEVQGRLAWSLLGKHNQKNALNAIAAARHVGVPPSQAIASLAKFSGVKRRLEVIFENDDLILYDDFAHHPSAIRMTLEGLRKAVGSDEILVIIEPRTHTMSLGTLRAELSNCVAAADHAIWFRGENIKWDLNEVSQASVIPSRVLDKHTTLVAEILKAPIPGKKVHAVIMSNGAFGGIYDSLVNALNG